MILIISSILSLVIFINIFWVIYNRMRERWRGWRTQPLERDSIVYQEFINNQWESIEIEGERKKWGKRKILYLKSEEDWESYPDWAKNRRKIVSRIKKNYPPKRIEYLPAKK